MARKKCTSIGGQAVIEGVMMRGERSMATAVRDEKGDIVIESKYIKPVKEKNFLFRTPFLRGIFNFVSTMVVGMGTLMRSGEVFEGEVEPGKGEKWLAKKFGINVFNLVMGISVVLGILLSLGLFFFLPQLITTGLQKLFSIDTANLGVKIGMNFLEGVVRMFIFVLYIWATTLMKDVRRTYMYHGAEHKTISCFEHDLELNVENARKMTTVHDRCGTTFMFIIMVVSVLVFSLTGWTGNFWARLGMRLALLPIVSGVSYEVLKFLAKFDNPFVRVLKAPGLWLQKLTTKQPDDSMLEVAIAAFKTVQAMDADATLPESRFITTVLKKKALGEVSEALKGRESAEGDAEVLLRAALDMSEEEFEAATHIRSDKRDAAIRFAAELCAGKGSLEELEQVARAEAAAAKEDAAKEEQQPASADEAASIESGDGGTENTDDGKDGGAEQ